MSESERIPLGCLSVGNTFRFAGRTFKVGHIIRNTNGYVACTSEDGEVHRIYIDTLVYKEEK